MKIFSFFHIHKFNKPIASMYTGFNTRNIIYECKCNKRKIFRRYFTFSEPLPIKTNNLITYKEFNNILNEKIT
jgi:hypothetical protein